MLYTGKLGNIIYQFYLNKKKKRFLTKKLLLKDSYFLTEFFSEPLEILYLLVELKIRTHKIKFNREDNNSKIKIIYRNENHRSEVEMSLPKV